MSTHMPSLFDDEYMQSVRPAGEKKTSGKKNAEQKEPVTERIPEPEVIPEPEDAEEVMGVSSPVFIEEATIPAAPDRDNSIQDIAKDTIVTDPAGAMVPEKDKVVDDDSMLQEDIHLEAIQADYFAFVEQEKPKKKSGIFFEPAPAVIKKDKEKEAEINKGLKADLPAIAEEITKEWVGDDRFVETGIVSGALEPDEAEKVITALETEVVATLPEWRLEEKYYGIGEVSKLFGVNISHIRFWTTEFNLKPRTTRKGDRLYSKQDIEKLRLIYHLVKEKKHTIKGAKEKLKTQKKTVSSNLDLKDALEELRQKLVALKDQL